MMHPLETRLAAAWPPEHWQDVTVLLAVSGGADSVALLRAMTALKRAGAGRLVAAHFNHRLRGGQSEADEAFVVALCRGLAIACEVGHDAKGELSHPHGEGIEEAARRVRYDFLAAAAARAGARYVATAHTADDQAETILHRILRGTGISGLAGMARVRPLALPLADEGSGFRVQGSGFRVQGSGDRGTGEHSPLPSAGEGSGVRGAGPGSMVTLIRPLLGLRRAELVAYLDELGQDYCHDASNDELRRTRNRIRQQLLPQLADEFNPAVVEALLRLGTLAAEVQAVIGRSLEQLYDRAVRTEGPDTVSLDLPPLRSQPRYVVRELVMAVWRRQGWPMQAMGLAQWDLLAEMVLGARSAAKPPQRHTLPGAIVAEVCGERLHLRRSGGA